ncbi:MAG: hypothetical protein ABSF25_07015 [Bryobacteraceae bacterium]|jgi:hypothetical protein
MTSCRASRAVLLFILCAAFAWAADISGQWTADWSDYGGGAVRHSTFTFKQDGTTLTGATKGEGSELQIRDGKVNGDDVSFVIAQKIGNREVTLTYTGRVSGNEIKFTVSFAGSDRTWDMTAKKAP